MCIRDSPNAFLARKDEVDGLDFKTEGDRTHWLDFYNVRITVCYPRYQRHFSRTGRYSLHHSKSTVCYKNARYRLQEATLLAIDNTIWTKGEHPKLLRKLMVIVFFDLKKLDLVQNAGLRYATGAFRTTPAQRLYCAAGMTSSHVRWQSLLLRQVAKHLALLSHIRRVLSAISRLARIYKPPFTFNRPARRFNV